LLPVVVVIYFFIVAKLKLMNPDGQKNVSTETAKNEKKKKMNLLSQIEEKIRERNRSRAESP